MEVTLKLSLLACLLAFCRVVEAEQRTWTDSTGKHTIRGELVGFDGSTVTLKKADGKAVDVKNELLSQDDRAFILTHPLTGIGYDAVSLADALPGMKEGTPAPPVTDGILIVDVFPTGPAEKAGLRAYDIIASVDEQPAKLRVGLYYRDPQRTYSLVVYRLEQAQANPAEGEANAAKALDATRKWQQLKLIVSVLPIEKINAIKAKICPLSIQSVRTGTDAAGTYGMVAAVRNRGRQAVVGFKVSVASCDKAGKPIRGGKEPVGVSRNRIEAGGEEECGVDLPGCDGTAKLMVAVEQVQTEDGKQWKPSPGFERRVTTK